MIVNLIFPVIMVIMCSVYLVFRMNLKDQERALEEELTTYWVEEMFRQVQEAGVSEGYGYDTN